MADRSQHFKWYGHLQAEPEQIWPLVTNTDLIFKCLNLSPVNKADFTFDPHKDNLQLATNRYDTGPVKTECSEWERPYSFLLVNRYEHGLVSRFKLQVNLNSRKEGTRITYQLELNPVSWYASLILFLTLNLILRYKLYKFKTSAEDYIWRNKNTADKRKHFEIKTDSIPVRQAESLCKKLSRAAGNTEISERIIKHLISSDENELLRINPNALADRWNLPRESVINCFLYAAKLGILKLNWDLYCPECHTLHYTGDHLNELNESEYCQFCEHTFKVNLSHSVQLTFRPDPSLRPIENIRFVLQSPHLKPNVAFQQILKPGQKRFLNIKLEEGTYHLRIPGIPGRVKFNVTSGGSENITASFNGFELPVIDTELGMEPNLVLYNRSLRDQVIILEKISEQKKELPASKITSLQLFRDLFSKELIRNGEKLHVDDLTLMFTDLSDSTGIYETEGDSTAAGRVIEHFNILRNAVVRHGGAIVKTIGDSVMAVFSNPEEAVHAYITAQKVFESDRYFKDRFKLKAGIHEGSCVAVNMNNRIDYFGSTVNIASRLVEISDQNNMTLSSIVADRIDIYSLLKNSGVEYRMNEISTSLKGFNQEQFSIKQVRINEEPALRLVV